MFSFLNPMFLWAAGAAVIPLVLHLLQKRRIVRVPFSTIRFLKLAERRSSHRVRLENLLLWLMRTALILLLAAGFAVPVLRTGAWTGRLGRPQRDVALVIDGSFSMQYRAGAADVWDRALNVAADIVDGLQEGDQVCVFVAADEVVPVVGQLTADLDFARTQIRALRAGMTPSDLCPATLAALETLDRETRRREREVHLITDGQALPWMGFGGADTRDAGLWQPSKVDRHTAFFVSLVGAAEPINFAPLSVELEPRSILSDMPFTARVRLLASGADGPPAVTLIVNGETVARREGVGGETVFAVPALPSGVHPARVETPPDNLDADNAFHFLIRVRDRLPVLCVGTAEDAFFLERALGVRPGAETLIEARRIDAAQLAGEDLGAYACIFLCNALPLYGQQVQQLEQAVRNGALLAVFPGDRAAPDDYGPDLWTCLPAAPAAVRDLPPASRRSIVYWADPQHPLLAPLASHADGAPLLTIRRRLYWDAPAPGARMILALGDDGALLLERTFGDGRVLLFSVPADRTWSNFPLSPFFLPIVHQVVQYGAGIARAQPSVTAARSLAVTDHIPSATADSTLVAPNGDLIPVRSTRQGARVVLTAEGLLEPGIYRLRRDGADAGPVLAVNLDRSESDLVRIDIESLRESIGVRGLAVADSRERLAALLEEHRVGRTLGEFLLWCALALSAAEVCYANRKSRSVRTLSETLGIDAGGRVRGGEVA